MIWKTRAKVHKLSNRTLSLVNFIVSQDSEDQVELNMTSRELNPKFYEASRAGQAIQHYINTVHGSPFRLYTVTQVHKARAEVSQDRWKTKWSPWDLL